MLLTIGAGRYCTLKVFLALRSRQAGLRPGAAGPAEKIRPHRYSERPANIQGKNFGLVEHPGEVPEWMQGYRDQALWPVIIVVAG